MASAPGVQGHHPAAARSAVPCRRRPDRRGALLDALAATKASGEPDHSIRIAAAKAILSTPVASADAQEEARRTERIYLPSPDDDEGTPRPTPNDPDEIRHRGEEAGRQRIAAEVEA
jgi:hypothetical protein